MFYASSALGDSMNLHTHTHIYISTATRCAGRKNFQLTAWNFLFFLGSQGSCAISQCSPHHQHDTGTLRIALMVCTVTKHLLMLPRWSQSWSIQAYDIGSVLKVWSYIGILLGRIRKETHGSQNSEPVMQCSKRGIALSSIGWSVFAAMCDSHESTCRQPVVKLGSKPGREVKSEEQIEFSNSFPGMSFHVSTSRHL